MLTKTKLIGISGCTNGGKTTLSKRLLLEFPNSYHFSQDDFYHDRVHNKEAYHWIDELQSYNFDVISCIDMKRFRSELQKLVELGKYDYIFLDGILLFEDDAICSMLDKLYFLDLDKEECQRRRKNRNYIIPDTGCYFEKCAWPEFLSYRQRCIGKSTVYNKDQDVYDVNGNIVLYDITYLNGKDLPETIFNSVLNDLSLLH